ncbi:hypothetical protein [Phreatobacter sp. AB_2022a]|uniref:hypothetical protein n=1 Tax=Phreatobacter sp. AB_2022a TaxID=3003134 RepID=UPI002286F379|nr:hypothetical protein [Phreatobacter sp. AB_2022a]MCZ0732680.1 hypothetical protein [Phreatobacter sp. AB_2022a]
MKKFVIAAALVAPLTAAVPALAQGVGDASGYFGAPAITTAAPVEAREFTARHPAGYVPAIGQVQVDRGQVPSSAFSTSN